jgi:hypothetical protein
MFCYTLWHFYAFSGTNLLTRCHSASSLSSAIFVFQKSYTRNILGIGWNKSQTSQYLMKLPEDQRGDGGGPRASHTIGWRGQPLARAPWWWGHLAHLLMPPFCLYIPPDGKNLKPDQFLETHRDPPPSSTRDWEGPEALPGTLPEREIATGGHLYRHACLQCDE